MSCASRRGCGRAGRAARPRRGGRACRASGRAAARRSGGSRPRRPPRRGRRSGGGRRPRVSWSPAVCAMKPSMKSTSSSPVSSRHRSAGLARDLRCLVEAGEHGQQPGARQQQRGVRVLGKERVERAERLVRRPRAVGERALEAEEIGSALAGQPGVVERLLRRVRVVLEVAAPVRDPIGERIPDVHQPGVVLGLLEQRQRRSHERLQLVDRRIGGEERRGSRRRRHGRAPRLSRRRPPAPARRRRRRALLRPPGSLPKSASARSSSSTTSSRAGRVSSSARSSSPAAARSSPRQSARRPAAASRSPARSARAPSGCPSSCR